MKNFDARMEEILRRSEELKREKRQRRKLVLTVIPVTLCCAACLGAVLLSLPSGRSGENGGAPGGWQTMDKTDRLDGIEAAVPGNNQMPEMYTENSFSMGQNVAAIHITGKGMDRFTDDPAVIAEVCSLLMRATASTPNYSTAGSDVPGRGEDPEAGTDGETTVGKTQSKDFYILSFVDSEGNTRQYRLNQSVLTQIATGETDFLMGDDLTELYGLLGLPVE